MQENAKTITHFDGLPNHDGRPCMGAESPLYGEKDRRGIQGTDCRQRCPVLVTKDKRPL